MRRFSLPVFDIKNLKKAYYYMLILYAQNIKYYIVNSLVCFPLTIFFQHKISKSQPLFILPNELLLLITIFLLCKNYYCLFNILIIKIFILSPNYKNASSRLFYVTTLINILYIMLNTKKFLA